MQKTKHEVVGIMLNVVLYYNCISNGKVRKKSDNVSKMTIIYPTYVNHNIIFNSLLYAKNH